MKQKQVFNPYLPSYEYIPDGEPHIFDGRLYIYGSHDRFGSAAFCLNDYICYSADIHDLSDWRYEGVIYRKEQDPRNRDISPDAKPFPLIWGVKPLKDGDVNPPGVHALYAPDVCKGPDGRYYLYYCLDCLPEIAVAVSDTPAGSYEFLGFVKHPDGTPLGRKENDFFQFDPGIFIENDSIYLFSGNSSITSEDENGTHRSLVMTLMPDMLTLKTLPEVLLPGPLYGDNSGFEGHEFFEASSLRKIGSSYYLIYSSIKSSELCYAVSRYPDHDYRFGGTLIDIGNIGLNGRTEDNAENPLGNTHGSIECINGRWYVFYHRQTARTQFSRQGCAEEILLDRSGHFHQAEVTSCGMNGSPLKDKGFYPAYICCHQTKTNKAVFSLPQTMGMDYPYLTQDTEDISPDNESALKDSVYPYQYLANMTDQALAGFKYFEFKRAVSLTLTLRGSAEGTITIRQDKYCGRSEIILKSDKWQDITVKCSFKEGIYPLYIGFSGKGVFDLLGFTFS